MKFRGSTYFITKVYMQQSLYIQDCARKDVATKISKYFGNIACCLEGGEGDDCVEIFFTL
jgi:hypothetical protein